MVSDDNADFLQLQMQILNERFHATIAAGGTFDEVKCLYLQMKSLYQQANEAGLNIAPETPTQYKQAQDAEEDIKLIPTSRVIRRH